MEACETCAPHSSRGDKKESEGGLLDLDAAARRVADFDDDEGAVRRRLFASGDDEDDDRCAQQGLVFSKRLVSLAATLKIVLLEAERVCLAY